MTAPNTSRTVYFTMVQGHPGAFRAGNAYTSRSVAESWTSFVSGAHGGLDVLVEECALHWGPDGKLDHASLCLLDERFNLDPGEDDE